MSRNRTEPMAELPDLDFSSEWQGAGLNYSLVVLIMVSVRE